MSAPISWSVFNLLASTIGPKIYISSWFLNLLYSCFWLFTFICQSEMVN
jgi:hypothetical protein